MIFRTPGEKLKNGMTACHCRRLHCAGSRIPHRAAAVPGVRATQQQRLGVHQPSPGALMRSARDPPYPRPPQPQERQSAYRAEELDPFAPAHRLPPAAASRIVHKEIPMDNEKNAAKPDATRRPLGDNLDVPTKNLSGTKLNVRTRADVAQYSEPPRRR